MEVEGIEEDGDADLSEFQKSFHDPEAEEDGLNDDLDTTPSFRRQRLDPEAEPEPDPKPKRPKTAILFAVPLLAALFVFGCHVTMRSDPPAKPSHLMTFDEFLRHEENQRNERRQSRSRPRATLLESIGQGIKKIWTSGESSR